jgi:anti-sigma factor RsiW
MRVFTNAEIRTYLKIAAAMVVAFLSGAMVYVIPLLLDPSEPPISWRVVLGTGLAAVIGGGVTSRFTRPGKESIAAQVNALTRITGLQPKHMIVVPSMDSDTTIEEAAAANPRIEEAAPIPPPSS